VAQGKRNNIDEDAVFKLAQRHWTKAEIAAFFDVHPDTITNNFQAVWLKGKEVGKANLRDAQWKRALNGSDTMLIWLGKNILGQKDKEVEEGFEGVIQTTIINNITYQDETI
jgi:hypothetical protein